LPETEEGFEMIRAIEPYRENGELGFAIVFDDDKVFIQTEDEWVTWANENFNEKGAIEFLKRLAIFSNDMYWENAEVALPSRPEYPWKGDDKLIWDMQRKEAEMVQFLDERHYIAGVNWAICTQLREELMYAPRWLMYASTTSGKSQALRYFAAASYRGHDYSNPSVAALYRDIEAFHPTVCIDSWQRIKRERKLELEWIYEKGFTRGGTVARVNEGGKVERFRVHSWLAIATKDMPTAEDLQNRSMMIPMAMCDSDFIPEDKIDLEAFAGLQARLLSVRLAMLTGALDVQAKVREAERIAREYEPRLQFRPKNIASSLLVPSLIWNDTDGQEAIMELIADSQHRSMQALRDSDDAQVFHALDAIVQEKRKYKTLAGKSGFSWSEITTRDVADQYNEDLIQAGNDKKDRTPTKTINRVLQVLGFDFVPGGKNRSYFNPETSEAAYKRNLVKFGPRGGSEEEDSN
jgi:hypothetical protein